MTKQPIAERHSEGEPSPRTVTPVPTKPPVTSTHIPKVEIVKKLDITVDSVDCSDGVFLYDDSSLMRAKPKDFVDAIMNLKYEISKTP